MAVYQEYKLALFIITDEWHCVLFFRSYCSYIYNAQPLDKLTTHWIYEIVEELSHKMNLPMPKLWLVTTAWQMPLQPEEALNMVSIAVTTGILNLLDAEELRGVLAHELAHIKNRDTLITTIAATFASAIGYLAYMLRHMAFWGSFNNDRRKENPFVLVISVF